MKVSVIAPLKNECPWVGYSVEAALPGVHEFVYAVDPLSDDGSLELLQDLKVKHGDKIKLLADKEFSFNPMDTAAYNNAFNACIEASTGDACFFLHPDMIVLNPDALLALPESTAWWTNVTSYAGDFQTIITKGRCGQWKNIHRKEMGLHYSGGYGSQNEDFYHSTITGTSYKHYGTEFLKYPFEVKDSGVQINHYCELKKYARRLQKMKLCLKTQNPEASKEWISEHAIQHPRVTLSPAGRAFGDFEFTTSKDIKPPEVFEKYKEKFESYTREVAHV